MRLVRPVIQHSRSHDRESGPVSVPSQRAGLDLMIIVDQHGLPGLDDGQDGINECQSDTFLHRVRFPVPNGGIRHAQKTYFAFGKCRHPAAIVELGVPADMVGVQDGCT